MKRYIPGIVGTIAIAVTSLLSNPEPAQAQAAYGSYIGVGPAFGLVDGGGDDRKIGGVIAVRYKFLEVPISMRVQGFFLSGSSAVVPTVSYDFPINWQTDAYIGAGYSFADGDEPSPLGNQNAFALQPGIDYMIPSSNAVIFGNAVIAFDAYRDSGDTAVSLQGGVGLRF
ncbi:hypothetical protein [Roseofilum casamattae]|uniref:Porin family protein n=1 Tax=Roseofilum casamattae BLCC-M143 TaxID=3022442 RepID=A0ABT7C0D5_9CYAN|nr:hypothetical protein [Roseofilum casamattae]MDJ1184146.1 hypothetical protein [Roseofilum casamattae BLCC-M143]